MYVPGIVADNNKFLIDIGTGYYVEKDIKGSLDFFKRKVDYLTVQLDKVISITQEKTGLRDSLVFLLQSAAAQSRQQQAPNSN